RNGIHALTLNIKCGDLADPLFGSEVNDLASCTRPRPNRRVLVSGAERRKCPDTRITESLRHIWLAPTDSTLRGVRRLCEGLVVDADSSACGNRYILSKAIVA